MRIATYEGVVENGRVQLPADVELPEKARVYVVVPEAVVAVEVPRAARICSPRLADPAQAVHFEMEVREEGTDAGL